jgi:hypothetical protein
MTQGRSTEEQETSEMQEMTQGDARENLLTFSGGVELTYDN